MDTRSMAAFIPVAIRLPASSCQHLRRLRTTASISTTTNTALSRRQFGKLALSTVALALVNSSDASLAASQRPEFITDDSGIKYFDVKTGTGVSPIEGDFVVIDYMGQRQVIPGLEAALASMKPGGQRKIVVPPSLAYGDKGVCISENGECLVPPGERLGYDITLLRVAIPPT